MEKNNNENKEKSMIPEFKITFTYPDSPEMFLREYSLMKPRTVYYRFHSQTTEADKKKIIETMNNNDNLLSSIFYMAMPDYYDINKRFLELIGFENNFDYKKRFFSQTIQKIFMPSNIYPEKYQDYASKINSCKFLQDNKINNDGIHKDLEFTAEDIDNFSIDILKVMDLLDTDHLSNRLPFQKIKTLHSFFSITDDKIQKIKEIRTKNYESFFYTYSRKPYTWENLTVAFSERFRNPNNPLLEYIITEPLMNPLPFWFLSRLISIYCCQKHINHKIVQLNNRRTEFNAMIKSNFPDFLSKHQESLENPLLYTDIDSLTISSPSLFYFFFCLYICLYKDTIMIRQECTIPIFLFASFFSIISSYINNYINHFLINTIDNHYVFFIGLAISALSMGIYIFDAVKNQMKTKKKIEIKWDTIDEALKKHENGDIIIE